MLANTIKYLYYISIIQKLILGAYYLPHTVISTEDTAMNNKKQYLPSLLVLEADGEVIKSL